MSRGCALWISGSKGQGHNAFITENGLCRIIAFPLHLSWNFVQRLHESRICPMDFGVKRSRSHYIDNRKWFMLHYCFPFTPFIKLHTKTPYEFRMCLIGFKRSRPPYIENRKWFTSYNCFPITSAFIKLATDSQRIQVVPLGQPHSSYHMSIVTLTFDLHYRVHPLVIVKMSAKFDEEAHNGLVSIVFTGSKHEGQAHWPMEPQQRCYIPSVMRCAGIKISMPTHSVDLSNIDLKSFNICCRKRYFCCWGQL